MYSKKYILFVLIRDTVEQKNQFFSFISTSSVFEFITVFLLDWLPTETEFLYISISKPSVLDFRPFHLKLLPTVLKYVQLSISKPRVLDFSVFLLLELLPAMSEVLLSIHQQDMRSRFQTFPCPGIVANRDGRAFIYPLASHAFQISEFSLSQNCSQPRLKFFYLSISKPCVLAFLTSPSPRTVASRD